MEKQMQEKTEQEVSVSAKQISEKKQDIKFDTRDYVIKYLYKAFYVAGSR